VADLSSCRTAALGGRLEQCPACRRQEYRYHSCRNRHCPRCPGSRRAAWLEREAGYLLPVEYHHVVFTLPAALAELARRRPRLVYGLLLPASSAAVLELAADPKYLGAQGGLVSMRHTGGQTLSLHPHVHVLATGGGLSCNRRGEVEDAPCWRSCRPGFFLPVRVLSRLFRGKFLAGLRAALEREPLAPDGDGEALSSWRRSLYGQEWVVYSQPPAADAAVVLKYLARYVHRVAISNSRLRAVTAATVTFSYQAYRRGGREQERTLSGEAFARRFVQHVLPRGFVRVRHYGLLANRGREAKLAVCRRQRLVRAVAVAEDDKAASQPRSCAVGGEGWMVPVGSLPRAERVALVGCRGEDSS
jgi:Putative transposase/Transposase zinc-binding domain